MVYNKLSMRANNNQNKLYFCKSVLYLWNPSRANFSNVTKLQTTRLLKLNRNKTISLRNIYFYRLSLSVASGAKMRSKCGVSNEHRNHLRYKDSIVSNSDFSNQSVNYFITVWSLPPVIISGLAENFKNAYLILFVPGEKEAIFINLEIGFLNSIRLLKWNEKPFWNEFENNDWSQLHFVPWLPAFIFKMSWSKTQNKRPLTRYRLDVSYLFPFRKRSSLLKQRGNSYFPGQLGFSLCRCHDFRAGHIHAGLSSERLMSAKIQANTSRIPSASSKRDISQENS